MKTIASGEKLGPQCPLGTCTRNGKLFHITALTPISATSSPDSGFDE